MTFPIWLSLRVAALAMLFLGPLGLALAWLQARRRYPLAGVVDAVVLLPLVLPPSVVGYFLIVVFGRRSPIGHLLGRIVFTPAAAVIASAIVALPMLVKTAQPAIEAVPTELEDVARTLGLGPLEVFLRVTLPAAWRGVVAGMGLAFARALGEFGATLMFAGDVPGRTNTMPIALYDAYLAGDDRRALLYVAVLAGGSLAIALAAARLVRR